MSKTWNKELLPFPATLISTEQTCVPGRTNLTMTGESRWLPMSHAGVANATMRLWGPGQLCHRAGLLKAMLAPSSHSSDLLCSLIKETGIVESRTSHCTYQALSSPCVPAKASCERRLGRVGHRKSGLPSPCHWYMCLMIHRHDSPLPSSDGVHTIGVTRKAPVAQAEENCWQNPGKNLLFCFLCLFFPLKPSPAMFVFKICAHLYDNLYLVVFGT